MLKGKEWWFKGSKFNAIASILIAQAEPFGPLNFELGTLNL
jgi:hypothetical protein